MFVIHTPIYLNALKILASETEFLKMLGFFSKLQLKGKSQHCCEKVMFNILMGFCENFNNGFISEETTAYV